MNKDLSVLRDPHTRSELKLQISQSSDVEELVNDIGKAYPVVSGIPRFVSTDNYASAFGEQWVRYHKTQLDSYTGFRHSEERLFRCMGLTSESHSLSGLKVLEAGSGAGRFTEILLREGADVHSFDFSRAVEANARNHSRYSRLTLVQADIYSMPFSPNSYDYVVCLGVLQHTPDPRLAIARLWEMVKPGGKMVIDHYRWGIGRSLPPPIGSAVNLYRPIILKFSTDKQFEVVSKLVEWLFPFHWRYRKNKFVKKILARLSPVHFYYPDIELRDRDMYYEWALLDTHDATTDVFKHYSNERKIHQYLSDLGATGIRVVRGGNGVEAICQKHF